MQSLQACQAPIATGNERQISVGKMVLFATCRILQAWNASYRRLRMILPGHPEKTEHDWEDVKNAFTPALAAIT